MESEPTHKTKHFHGRSVVPNQEIKEREQKVHPKEERKIEEKNAAYKTSQKRVCLIL